MNIKPAERIIGRREHDVKLKATEYINRSFDDVWAAVVRMHVMLAVVVVLTRRKSK